jgi:hypothetical protein
MAVPYTVICRCQRICPEWCSSILPMQTMPVVQVQHHPAAADESAPVCMAGGTAHSRSCCTATPPQSA